MADFADIYSELVKMGHFVKLVKLVEFVQFVFIKKSSIEQNGNNKEI